MQNLNTNQIATYIYARAQRALEGYSDDSRRAVRSDLARATGTIEAYRLLLDPKQIEALDVAARACAEAVEDRYGRQEIFEAKGNRAKKAASLAVEERLIEAHASDEILVALRECSEQVAQERAELINAGRSY